MFLKLLLVTIGRTKISFKNNFVCIFKSKNKNFITPVKNVDSCKIFNNFILGLIDIPIGEGKINNVQRMALHPNIPDLTKTPKSAKKAITRYKVSSFLIWVLSISSPYSRNWGWRASTPRKERKGKDRKKVNRISAPLDLQLTIKQNLVIDRMTS